VDYSINHSSIYSVINICIIMDTLALSILRFAFFTLGMVTHILSLIVTNPDWQASLEQRSIVSMMMFDNPDMLPEEMLLPALHFIKVMIVAIPIIIIWRDIVKPLLGVK
jgi:hypothetical protein